MGYIQILGVDAHKVIAFVFCVLVLFLIIGIVKWLSDQQIDDYQTSLDAANREYDRSYHKPVRVKPATIPQVAIQEPPSTTPLHTQDGGNVVRIKANSAPLSSMAPPTGHRHD